jgi:hypothetical protein
MLRKWIIIGFFFLSSITVYSVDLDTQISEYIKNGSTFDLYTFDPPEIIFSLLTIHPIILN